MKRNFIILTAGLFCALSTGTFRAAAELEVSAGVSIHAKADFYEPLASHGAWVDVGSFGHCWRPAGVAVDWRPYCNGSWEWTDNGWYWASDEPWAWACYHYGTWDYNSNLGWVWVPDVEWAPCWVNWRIGGGYIGWVPCAPPGVVIAPSLCVFVDGRHFHDHIQPGIVVVNNITLIKKTKVINGITRENRTLDGRSQKAIVNNGPGLKAVEKTTGQKFTAVSVRDVDRRTSASIPESFKNRTAGPANAEKPGTVQPQHRPMESQAAPNENPQMPDRNFRPDNNPNGGQTPHNVTQPKEIPREKIVPDERSVPQTPSEHVVSPAHQEVPVEKGASKEFVPPHQAVVPPSPGTTHETPRNNPNQGGDKDKDNGGRGGP